LVAELGKVNVRRDVSILVLHCYWKDAEGCVNDGYRLVGVGRARQYQSAITSAECPSSLISHWLECRRCSNGCPRHRIQIGIVILQYSVVPFETVHDDLTVLLGNAR